MTLDRAISIDDLRRIARARLPRAVFDFYDGGAEDEVTLADNRAAYSRVKLMPKVLVDVSRIDTSTEILGFRAQLPFTGSRPDAALAPTLPSIAAPTGSW